MVKNITYSQTGEKGIYYIRNTKEACMSWTQKKMEIYLLIRQWLCVIQNLPSFQ